MKIYRFRDCLLNTLERQVIREGKRLELTPKTFDVLQLLVEKAGEIVSKDEILGTVWNGSLVEEGNLPVHVSKLRRLLNENKEEHFIETVQGSGYRFVSPVKLVNANEWRKHRGVVNNSNKSVAAPVSKDTESHRFYLRGKYLLEKRTAGDIQKAIECFRKSFSKDPSNVLSYVEIIECYLVLYVFNYISHADISTKTRPFLSIISELEQQVDTVQAMYGGMKMYVDWKFQESEDHFRLALRLNPDCLIALYRYTDLLILFGRFSEALIEVQKTMQIDTLSPFTYRRIGRLFWKMGRFDTAVIYLNDLLELEANDWEALIILGAVLSDLDRHDEALLVLERSLSIQYNIETLSMIGYVNAIVGRKDKACEIIEEVTRHSGGVSKQAILLARIHLALGETETVYRFLNLAFEQHDADLIGLKFDPRWRRLRSEPGFEALIKKVGLPVN